MDIKALPAGTSCLVDANVFIYHFANLSDECSKFIERVGRYEVPAFITTTILAEVLHRRMMGGGDDKELDYPRSTNEETESEFFANYRVE